jgi:hypothetical protein
MKRRAIMTHFAASPAYAENIINNDVLTGPSQKIKVKPKKHENELTEEDKQIIESFNAVKNDLDNLHNRYDQTTDLLLLESIIYELKAANLKFMYYHNLCKERGIVCRMVKK